jgi:hypothetical protein
VRAFNDMDSDNTGTIDRRKFLIYLDQLQAGTEKENDEKSDGESESSDDLSVTSESSVSSFEETDSQSHGLLSSEHDLSSHNDLQKPAVEPERPSLEAEAEDEEEQEEETKVESPLEFLVKQLQIRDHEFVILAEYLTILKQLSSQVTPSLPLSSVLVLTLNLGSRES